MEKKTLRQFDDSLVRCTANPAFFDRFYERFLASSPKIAEKFATTDFVRQKRALRASLHLMLLAAGDGEPGRYLESMADRHSRHQLGIGAELYDIWLDSLLATVKEFDPQFDARVGKAWEQVMMVGISYLLDRY